MTKKQRQQFNMMRAALIRISKEFMTPEQLQKKSHKMYGLNPAEAIEMSYDNIQSLAAATVKGVKELKIE